MSDPAIIVRDDPRLLVEFTAGAMVLKTAALESSALIGRVTNAVEQQNAVDAQTKLQGILTLAEKSRKACKAPVLDYGKRIDAAAEKFCDELKTEMSRISGLVGSFQQLELARARAAEQARNAELSRLEREKAEAIAKAKTHDAVDAIQEHFNRKAEMVPVHHEPVRSEGQRIAPDWEITVTDIHQLYRMHANCVDLKPRLSEIKNLLKMGVTVVGVIAKPIVKAGVRIGKEPMAIEA